MATIINKYEIDALTGEEKVTAFTAEDFEVQSQIQTEIDARLQEEQNRAIARKALLDKLGITADEAKLLLS